ncbi:hypothetical protein B5V90_02500 [Heyndrickxia sporothermodurans]|nr:hypothetical protein B5V90_02500 [Heyndrickxia sporothermodurans]
MKVIDTLRQLFEDSNHEYDLRERKLVVRQGERVWQISCKYCKVCKYVPLEQDLTRLPPYLLNNCEARNHYEASRD